MGRFSWTIDVTARVHVRERGGQESQGRRRDDVSRGQSDVIAGFEDGKALGPPGRGAG